VDNGAHVLNLSIGRNGPPAPAIREAIAYAVSRGAFVAVAAGNLQNSAKILHRHLYLKFNRTAIDHFYVRDTTHEIF